MKRLTPDQADLLRQIRPKLRPVAKTLDSIRTDLANGCECDHDPVRCRLCRLYSIVTDLEDQLEHLRRTLDRALERGPVPGKVTNA
jgi:hypothetical protein